MLQNDLMKWVGIFVRPSVDTIFFFSPLLSITGLTILKLHTMILYMNPHNRSIPLVLFQAVESALNALKSSSTEAYYRKQAWEVVKCFLVSVMNLDDDKQSLLHLFSHTR